MNKKTSPPRKALNLMLGFMDLGERKNFAEYVDSVYKEYLLSRSLRAASIWFWSQFIRSLPRLIIKSVEGDIVMLKNYLKIALRNIKRQEGYSAIIVGSLALTMAIGLLTMVWVEYEMSYDRFHKDSANIYRFLYQTTRESGITETESSVPYALPFIIKETFPEVKAASRVMKLRPDWFESSATGNAKASVVFVDPEFLTMFDFSLVKGDPHTVLNNPRSVALTESTAQKFFGAADPVGKILLAQKSKIPFEVTGVLKEIPENSHIDFDLMMRASDFKLWYDNKLQPDDWSTIYWDLYVALAPGTNVAGIEDRVSHIANDRNPDVSVRLSLQPLREIHLQSENVRSYGLSDRRQDSMSMLQIRTFLFIALAVLLMGCFNYVNLATARFMKRAREIGVRKVNGATKGDIMVQFLGESVLVAFIALAAAVFLAASIGLPILRNITGLSFDLALLHKARLLFAFFGLALFAGLAAGFYPALFVSSFSPVISLKESFIPGKSSFVHFRRILVAAQVICSAALISLVAVFILQLRYIDHKDLGFKRDSLLVIRNDIDRNQISSLKNELLANPAVRGVATGFLPVMGVEGHHIRNQTLFWEGKSPETEINMDWHIIDEDYLRTYGLELVQGRFFSRDFPSDRDNYVVNESAVKAMSLPDPVGKVFKVGDRSGQIIGVIKDFHVGTLKAEIRPMYFMYASGYFSIAVRIDVQNVAAAIEHIAKVVKKFDPGRPFDYMFLDDYLSRMYDSDRRNAMIVSIFGFISVLISCLGLFGLISFMAEQRTKEIGIRKVLGAPVIRIVRMMFAEFTVLIGIAVLVAWPIGYFFASRWLGEFAYRINLSWWIFGGAGLIVFVLTLVAMSFKAVQAATANPVDSLRYE
jgi:putative ABC transport system permease protein